MAKGIYFEYEELKMTIRRYIDTTHTEIDLLLLDPTENSDSINYGIIRLSGERMAYQKILNFLESEAEKNGK